MKSFFQLAEQAKRHIFKRLNEEPTAAPAAPAAPATAAPAVKPAQNPTAIASTALQTAWKDFTTRNADLFKSLQQSGIDTTKITGFSALDAALKSPPKPAATAPVAPAAPAAAAMTGS